MKKIKSGLRTQKYKIDRRLGMNILGRAKSPFLTRPSMPGQHAASLSKRKLSDHGMKILECAKVRHLYGDIRQSTLKQVVKEALRLKINKSYTIIKLLETRLASVVYRTKWAMTPWAAKQLVSHKNILLNGKPVNIGSCKLKIGDKIALVEHMRQNPHVLNAIKNPERNIPEFLRVNEFETELISLPTTSNITLPVKINFEALLEFFTR